MMLPKSWIVAFHRIYLGSVLYAQGEPFAKHLSIVISLRENVAAVGTLSCCCSCRCILYLLIRSCVPIRGSAVVVKVKDAASQIFAIPPHFTSSYTFSFHSSLPTWAPCSPRMGWNAYGTCLFRCSCPWTCGVRVCRQNGPEPKDKCDLLLAPLQFLPSWTNTVDS